MSELQTVVLLIPSFKTSSIYSWLTKTKPNYDNALSFKTRLFHFHWPLEKIEEMQKF